MAKVSTIMPAHNAEPYIEEAIKSVLSQTYKDIELIVIDDGSTDNTFDIVKSFGSRVKYVRHNEKKGPSAARNTGIRETRGEYVAFLDADDVWMPAKIENQLKLFEINEDLALVYSNCYKINRLGERMGVYFSPVELHRGSVFEKLLLNNFIASSSTVVKRQVLDEIGIFDENFLASQDYDLYIRISEGHKVDFVDSPLVKYRLHSEGITSSKRSLMLEEAIKITRFYRDKISSKNPVLAQRLDKRIAKYMFYIAIWSLDHANRRDAIRKYMDCIRTMAFDWKIALGSVFFIMPNFISTPLMKNLIRIQHC